MTRSRRLLIGVAVAELLEVLRYRLLAMVCRCLDFGSSTCDNPVSFHADRDESMRRCRFLLPMLRLLAICCLAMIGIVAMLMGLFCLTATFATNNHVPIWAIGYASWLMGLACLAGVLRLRRRAD